MALCQCQNLETKPTSLRLIILKISCGNIHNRISINVLKLCLAKHNWRSTQQFSRYESAHYQCTNIWSRKHNFTIDGRLWQSGAQFGSARAPTCSESMHNIIYITVSLQIVTVYPELSALLAIMIICTYTNVCTVSEFSSPSRFITILCPT